MGSNLDWTQVLILYSRSNAVSVWFCVSAAEVVPTAKLSIICNLQFDVIDWSIDTKLLTLSGDFIYMHDRCPDPGSFLLKWACVVIHIFEFTIFWFGIIHFLWKLKSLTTFWIRYVHRIEHALVVCHIVCDLHLWRLRRFFVQNITVERNLSRWTVLVQEANLYTM